MTTASSSRPWTRWIPPLLATLLVVVLAAALLRGSGESGGPLVGKTAPLFTLTTLDGAPLSLASLQGRPVVINFWASWCVPCREEAPLLRDLAERQRAGGLAVVGVVYQDTAEQARAFAREYGLAFPSVLDPGSRVAIDYGVGAVPETFFIDASGTVTRHVRGVLTPETIEQEATRRSVSP